MENEKKQSGLGMILGGAAGAAVGQGMGMIFGKMNDKRQLKQQRKLQDLQIEGQSKMAEISRLNQMKMWNDTNYSAEMEQMEKAGLGIGMMYGGSGGGGATAQSAGGNVSGASADGGAARTGMGLQMAAQLALMQAQKENIEADTENKKAGADSTTTETRSKEVKAKIDEATEAEQRDRVMGEARSAAAKGIIDEQTQQHVIKRMQSEAVGVAIENKLKEANVAATYAKIRQIENEIRNAIQDLSIKKRAVTVQEINSAWQESVARRGGNLTQEGLDLKAQTDMINSVLKAAAIGGGKTIIE